MDKALGDAARALSEFDPLAALRRVALREDPEALALRGIAMAQLGDYAAARTLLDRAVRSVAPSDARMRARCLAAQGEVALASRDVRAAGRVLDAAVSELDALGDRLNALFVRLQRVRHLVLVGAVGDAATLLDSLDLTKAPARLRALADLVGADIAVRSLDSSTARTSLLRARRAARTAAIVSLSEEVERALRELDEPVARVVEAGVERLVRLDEVEKLHRSTDLVPRPAVAFRVSSGLDALGGVTLPRAGSTRAASAFLAQGADSSPKPGTNLRAEVLVVDACRRTIGTGNVVVPLVTRPVLLAIGVALASALPLEASRESLAEAAFGTRRVNESTRARLRVEIGRLRRAIVDVAAIESTASGYVLRPRRNARVVVLLPPAPGESSSLLALLRGGESWTTSALAAAMGTTQRTVQRALVALRDDGHVEGTGRGRSQRWIARPPEGFATSLLLVMRGPND